MKLGLSSISIIFFSMSVFDSAKDERITELTY
jgi:hypothetical protein